MLRSVGTSSLRLLSRSSSAPQTSIVSALTSHSEAAAAATTGQQHAASFSTKSNGKQHFKPGTGVPIEQMPYYHHTKKSETPLPHGDPRRPPKFKSPRKRASKLFHELNVEAVDKSAESNPNVLKVPFRVGDAIEIEMVSMGGVNSSANVDKLRGVVLGRSNRGLGSSVQIRDVMYGEPIDRQIMLHSPLLKSLKVLEKNFVHKGKKKVKRAKLYYLRDRLPVETRVTKW
uniref:50S ribosomal protein L19, chloroplastic n=1 Tax=Ditylum brightwellii TaxID=49249 RepID=A0A6S8Z0T6_9STRA|mmetsp:Transcript_9810/g.13150  ORF Transcript_9810/g.13150 Transcript_9810/m.13150 type:complete len:230 (-) Transcript_9810:292-981(-)